MREINTLTGRSLPYHSREALTGMLRDHFHITSLQSETRTVHFPSVRDVLRHIRQTGVGGLGRSRWLPGKFKAFEQQYISRFATDKGLPVTYASTFVVAKKKE